MSKKGGATPVGGGSSSKSKGGGSSRAAYFDHLGNIAGHDFDHHMMDHMGAGPGDPFGDWDPFGDFDPFGDLISGSIKAKMEMRKRKKMDSSLK